MCILRSASENSSESEWGPSGYVDPSGQGDSPVPAKRTPRGRSGAALYRHIVGLLSEPQVLDTVQHALASSVLSSAQGFSYGRREQLLQALVSCMHALCIMEEPQAPAAAAAAALGASRSTGPMARRLALNSCISNMGSGGPNVASSQSNKSSTKAAKTSNLLIERLNLSTCGKLIQLISVGGSQSGGGGGGSGSGLNPSLAEACLCLISLMTTASVTRRMLLMAAPVSVFGCLSAIIANTASARLSAGGSLTPVSTPTGATPRPGATATAIAAAAIGQVRGGTNWM